MKLYEIDSQLEALVDPETGEIMDFDLFSQLHMEREQKIEGMGLWVKNLVSEAEAIKAEEANLKSRRVSAEKKAERLEEYLKYILQGEKFQTPKLAITFRKTSSVQIEDEESFKAWAQENNADLIKLKIEPSKTAIKEAIKAGEEVKFASMVDGVSMTIK